VFFKANIANNIPFRRAMKKLPSGLAAEPSIGARAIRSVAALQWRKPGRPTVTNVHELIGFNRTLRQDLHFINGAQTLWYARTPVTGPKRLNRQLPTLSAERDMPLSTLTVGLPAQWTENWLLSEFIQMSAHQFIDEIASEMTGYQFLVPNVRAPF
jgi:hypothetical protein